MGNPSKLSLYIVSMTAGDGLRTIVKAKVVISNEQLRSLLREKAEPLMNCLEVATAMTEKYAGNIKTAASLSVASDYLIEYIIPLASICWANSHKLDVEVMFNDPVITLVGKRGHLDAWRKNEFNYKRVGKQKFIIEHAGKWAAFDGILSRLGGKICYNHDDTLREMVGELTTLRRNKKL